MVLPVVKSFLVLDADTTLECCRISLYLYHEEAFVLQIYDPLRMDCWFPFMHLVPIVSERYHYENRDYIYEEDLYGNSISFFFIHRSIDFSTNESSRTSMMLSFVLSLVPRMIPKSIVWCLNCPLCMISLMFCDFTSYFIYIYSFLPKNKNDNVSKHFFLTFRLIHIEISYRCCPSSSRMRITTTTSCCPSTTL